jgi:hypothetical protein
MAAGERPFTDASGAAGPSEAPFRLDEGQELAIARLLEEPTLAPELRVVAGMAGLERTVRNPRVQKSGLALVGHFHGVEPWRIQILGATELSFLETLDGEARRRACFGFAAQRPCAFVVTRGVEAPAELVEAIWIRLGIWPKVRSSGAVTEVVITSGLAPGRKVCTWMVG